MISYNFKNKYLKYKIKYLSLVAGSQIYTVAPPITAPAATPVAAAAAPAVAPAASASANDKSLNLQNCLSVYSNLGGTKGQFNTIELSEANAIYTALEKTKQEILAYQPQFLHIVFGGSCHSNSSRLRYNKCISRRFFWPYQIYDGLVFNTESKVFQKNNLNNVALLPRQAILIIDPSDTDISTIPELQYLNEFDDSDDDSDDDSSIDNTQNQAEYKKLIKIWHLKKWAFSTKNPCIFTESILNMIEIIKTKGGIISILDEIKAYAKPVGPAPGYMLKFINYALLNPRKVLFISWQPRIITPGINKPDDIKAGGDGNMALIIKKAPIDNTLPFFLRIFPSTSGKIYWSDFSTYYDLINLSHPYSSIVEYPVDNEDLPVYRSGICPYIAKEDNQFYWKKKLCHLNEGFMFDYDEYLDE